jgi:hypothetical protein
LNLLSKEVRQEGLYSLLITCDDFKERFQSLNEATALILVELPRGCRIIAIAGIHPAHLMSKLYLDSKVGWKQIASVLA